MLKADIEIGGFDQLFNLKAGRIIQKHYGMPEQDVLTVQMLEGTDGRKMSTSWGNVITIVDEPNDMYGKVMSIKDELIEKYLILCAELPMEEIKGIMEVIKKGGNPKDAKMRLGREIVALYHGKEKADKAEENFIQTFKQGEIPKDIQIVKCKVGEALVNIVLKEDLVKSKTEWRRLVDEGAVSEMESGEKISDPEFKISKNLVLKVGKRRFLKVEVE
jgi:tyrosyl-tRNA synthetase